MKASRDRSPAHPAWRTWVGVALVAPLVCFVAGSAYVWRLSAEIRAASLSIATNGGPSIVELATLRNGFRRIETRAMRARPGSVAQDRAAMARYADEVDRAERAYRELPDYPGELQAYQAMQRLQPLFFAAVDRLLDRAEQGVLPTEDELERLHVAAEELSEATGNVTKINADQVVAAGRSITALRAWAMWLAIARDALAFAFVVVGTTLGIRAARHEMEMEVAEERARLDEERVAELDVFAGRVAHDLRDLVGVVLMRASVGEHATTLGGATEALARIRHQSHRMSETIDALLTFARSAARPAPGARSDARTIVQEVVADARCLAGEGRTQIVVEPLSRGVVACEPTVLAIVLSNLVRNAVKYGDDVHGAGHVTLRSYRRCARLVCFEVEDTGPGLPPGAEEHVFEPFMRLREAEPVKAGIGLGLATVKRLVEANGGQVGVDSHPGTGCCFWFTLPLALERAA